MLSPVDPHWGSQGNDSPLSCGVWGWWFPRQNLPQQPRGGHGHTSCSGERAFARGHTTLSPEDTFAGTPSPFCSENLGSSPASLYSPSHQNGRHSPNRTQMTEHCTDPEKQPELLCRQRPWVDRLRESFSACRAHRGAQRPPPELTPLYHRPTVHYEQMSVTLRSYLVPKTICIQNQQIEP